MLLKYPNGQTPSCGRPQPATDSAESVDPIEDPLLPTLYRVVLLEHILHSANCSPQMRVE